MNTDQEYIYNRSSKHFIERLETRYNIKINIADYDEICNLPFVGKFTKNRSAHIGFVFIQTVKVWCIRNLNYGLLTTALPSNISTDNQECLICCFARPIRGIATIVLEHIQILLEVNILFENRKEAALYYFKGHAFPGLMIEKYAEGKVDPFKICREIRKVIQGDNPKLIIGIINKEY